MFKFILILVLLIYILNKISVFVFRVMGRPQQAPPQYRRPPEGSIHVDPNAKKMNKKGGIKGGDYVDYEEVK
jgi:hypothetical protein